MLLAKPDTPVKLRTYIVEDNATIRENLIGTLEELAFVEAVGMAETEDDGKRWLSAHSDQWDLAIVDLFLRHVQQANLGADFDFLVGKSGSTASRESHA